MVYNVDGIVSRSFERVVDQTWFDTRNVVGDGGFSDDADESAGALYAGRVVPQNLK
jgi:hypothetical protein